MAQPGDTKINPEHCYKVWLEANAPTLHELRTILLQQGHDVSVPTLSRYKDAMPEWLAAFEDKRKPLSTRLGVICRHLASYAKEVKPDVFDGLGAQLLVKFHDSVEEMVIKTPDDAHRLLDAYDRVRGFKHDQRGIEIAQAAGITSPLGGTGGVLATLTAKKPAPLKAPAQAKNGAH
jgi:hypothetical protein